MNEQAIANFSRAAGTYDDASVPQKQIAAKLIELAGGHIHRPPESIFETGCGTGNLTTLILNQWPQARVQISDASPAMLDAAKAKFSDRVGYKQFMLGSQPVCGDFDFILSNMTLQWTAGIATLAKSLLGHCRTLAFSVPVDGTFANWIAAHQRLGLQHGVHNFAAPMQLKEQLAFGGSNLNCFEIVDFPVHFDDPIEFVRSLRRTGTSTPRPGHTPVNLRRILAEFPNGLTTVYRVAFVVLSGEPV